MGTNFFIIISRIIEYNTKKILFYKSCNPLLYTTLVINSNFFSYIIYSVRIGSSRVKIHLDIQFIHRGVDNPMGYKTEQKKNKDKHTMTN